MKKLLFLFIFFPTAIFAQVTSGTIIILKPGDKFQLSVYVDSCPVSAPIIVRDTLIKRDTIRLHDTVYQCPPVTTKPDTTKKCGNCNILLYATGYNTVSDLDPYGNGQWGAGTLESHLSTNIYKDGPASFKSVPANVSSGIRSEVQYPSSLIASEGAIEYDVMYETIFQNNGHSLQFHPLTSGGSASPGLWHENGQFMWVNWKGGTNTKYPTGFKIPQGKWLHCVFEYKVGSAGYMKFTVDGVVILDKKGIQVGDGSGAYLKVGVNMWQTQASVVYYDNLKIWKKA